MKKAVICGYYGMGNAGDEALLTSLLQMLPPQLKPIVLSNNPIETAQLHQVETCHSRSPQKILVALKQSNCFIWGGGSLLQDASSIASPLYYCALMALSSQLGLYTIAWAQGIGPLNHYLIRLVSKSVLKNVSAISIRDVASSELLSSWNIESLIAPDPVWALESISTENFSSFAGKKVAVNLRPHKDLNQQKLTNLAKALNLFGQASATSILLVPFQASQDLAIAQSVSALLDVPHEIIQLQDPKQLKGIFQHVDMLIGMRFHSLIMAAAEGALTFALSYDPKVDQLMQQAQIPGWKVSQIPSSPEQIAQAWLKRYVDGQPLSQQERESFRQQALYHRELLLGCHSNSKSL